MCEIRPNHWRGRKGGESMSLEGMKQVTEAEQSTRAQKAEAEGQPKRPVAGGERDGKAALAQARADPEAQVKELLRQAEDRAAGHAAEVMAQAEQACAALRKRAEERLDQAADTIVGRVVKTDVHC